MKNSFKIFYSWQLSTPEKDNKQKILNSLQSAVDRLKQDDIELTIDQDSRNTTRADSIDYIILQKIPRCDFFIGDITPIAVDNKSSKLIPNPNVMLELGYATKSIGWARCVLVWNLKYGNIDQAPFDIRNRSIVKYNSETDCTIDLYNIFKQKIDAFDQILEEQKEDDIDYMTFQYWKNLISPQELQNIIEKIMTNCGYHSDDFDILDKFQAQFNTCLANHYRNSSLEAIRKDLNYSVRAFCFYLAGSAFDRADKNNTQCSYFKMNDQFTKYDYKVEAQIIQKINSLGNDVLKNNKKYYEALQSAFGYLG